MLSCVVYFGISIRPRFCEIEDWHVSNEVSTAPELGREDRVIPLGVIMFSGSRLSASSKVEKMSKEFKSPSPLSIILKF